MIIVFFTIIVKYSLLMYSKNNREVVELIVYTPFWETLRASEETTYTLIKNHRISSSTLDKLRKNRPLNTTTLNDLCRILHCSLEQIAQYVPSEEDQTL